MDLTNLSGLSLSELNALVEEFSVRKAELLAEMRAVVAARDLAHAEEEARRAVERLKLPPEEAEKVLGTIISAKRLQVNATVHPNS